MHGTCGFPSDARMKLLLAVPTSLRASVPTTRNQRFVIACRPEAPSRGAERVTVLRNSCALKWWLHQVVFSKNRRIYDFEAAWLYSSNETATRATQSIPHSLEKGHWRAIWTLPTWRLDNNWQCLSWSTDGICAYGIVDIVELSPDWKAQPQEVSSITSAFGTAGSLANLLGWGQLLTLGSGLIRRSWLDSSYVWCILMQRLGKFMKFCLLIQPKRFQILYSENWLNLQSERSARPCDPLSGSLRGDSTWSPAIDSFPSWLVSWSQTLFLVASESCVLQSSTVPRGYDTVYYTMYI